MRLIGATIAGVLLVSGLLLFTHALKSRHFDVRFDTSIVRLHNADGNFFCSGTVINRTQIVTAAHCVMTPTLFGMMLDPTISIEVRTQDGLPTKVIAHVRNVNPRLDTAMLEGDFHLFQNREIVTNPLEIDQLMLDPEAEIVACGYPLGGDLVCNRITHIDHLQFFYMGSGFLYPGMSGGPVIDVRTGRVIAVNQAVGAGPKQNQIVMNPLVEFFYNMLHG